MTNAEYDASVQALLGTTKTPSTNFPPDSRQVGGYTLNDAQRIDPVMAKALDDAALALVAEARTANKLVDARAVHQPDARRRPRPARTTFITSFGAQGVPARAVATTETTDLVALYKAGADSPRHLQRRHRPGDARDPAVGRASSTSRRWATGSSRVTDHADATTSWRANLVVPRRGRAARSDAAST